MQRNLFASGILGIVVSCTSALSAHQLDEYLGLTHIEIGLDRVQLFVSLTPGAEVVAPVLAVIDRNRDDDLSIEEQQRYVDKVRTHLAFAVDDERPPLRVVEATFPPVELLRQGTGVVQITFEARMAPRAPGNHSLFYANNNSDELSVYVVNALKPATPDIVIGRQERDWFQRQVCIDYEVREPGQGLRQLWSWIAVVTAASTGMFLLLARLRTRRVKPPA